MRLKLYTVFLFVLSIMLTGCGATDYEFSDRNAVGAIAGAGMGAGGAAFLGGSEPIVLLSGMGGAAFGYYVTTLRAQSEEVLRRDGVVFAQGDFVMIDIPSDALFEVNSSEMLCAIEPVLRTDTVFEMNSSLRCSAEPILRSVVVILKRYPQNDILVSGNTSGFAVQKYEQKLSEERAYKVAKYLWNHGINDYRNYNTKDGLNDYLNPKKMRKLTYTGFGNAFPIANHIYNDSIRQNSRIQITAYPKSLEIEHGKLYRAFYNIGKYK